MSWSTLFEQGSPIVSRAELLAAGATPRLITSAVKNADLLRVRRDHYALPGTDRHVLRAVRIGGRISCDTALRAHGVFGFDRTRTHVHVPRAASRLRSPMVGPRPLTRPLPDAELHWYGFVDPSAGSNVQLDLVDSLASVLRCGDARHAIASLDNALFQGKIRESDLASIFERVPAHLRDLRDRVDGRCEAGQETVLRLAFEDAGLDPDLQVWIDGVGRVDFVLEGRLICEADSRLAHDGWDLHVRDRDRDLAAARLGYMSLRPTYNRTMFRTAEVVDAALRLLDATRRFRVTI